MKNTIIINAKNSCTCDLVSNVDDGTNSLFLEIHADVSQNPKLEIGGTNVTISKDIFTYQVASSYWVGTGTLQFRIVDDMHTGDYFNVAKVSSLTGNIVLKQTDNFNYTLVSDSDIVTSFTGNDYFMMESGGQSKRLDADNIYDNLSTAKVWSLIRDKVYPVGSIYMSFNSTSPATLFGGTWEQIKGRFLLGVGANDANSNTSWGSLSASAYNVSSAKIKGGKYAHNHSQASTTGGHTLTVNEIPSHTHRWAVFVEAGPPGSGWSWMRAGAGTEFTTKATGGGGSHSHSLSAVNNTNALPPFYSVYMWQRTA